MNSLPPATVAVPLVDIVSYDLQYNGPGGTLALTLDNRGGDYDTLATGRLGADLVLTRGADCAGTDRGVDLEPFVIDRFTRSLDGKQIEIHAFNYYRLLDLWAADFLHYFTSISLADLVETIAGLAGIPATSDDSDSIWTATISFFTIQPGQTAGEALASLQTQYQFASRMTAPDTLHSFVLDSAPSADYTFGTGAGEHPTIIRDDYAVRTLPPVTHAQVIGDGAAGEALAVDLQAESGRQFTHRVTKRYVSSSATATTAAEAIINKATQQAEQARITALPAFNLQPFDAVSADDWTADTVRYITAIREIYNPMRRTTNTNKTELPWRQTLSLAAPTRDSAGSEWSITAGPAGLPSLTRGTVVSFDTDDWTALTRLEGSASAAPIPLADFASETYLTEGQDVAVLLFDPANPTDGLIIGSYDYQGSLSRRDLYAADDRRGLAKRIHDRLGFGVTDHFRSGVIPTGYAWQGAPFAGTPSTITWSLAGDYLSLRPDNTAHRLFLSTAVANDAGAWSGGTYFTARVATGHTTEIGIRLDDGSDNNYGEFYLTGVLGLGWARLDFRYRTGGGAVTTNNTHISVPFGEFITLSLYS